MADATCSIVECDRKTFCRGWCRAHYSRWLRHDDPLAGYRSRGAPLPSCSVDGCTETPKRIVRGMCDMHLQRFYSSGAAGPGEKLRILDDDRSRWWSYVDRNGPIPNHRPDLGPCWMWTGGVNGDGYGAFRFGPDAVGAHRWGWLTFVGPIPDEHEVDHLCHNRACVNYERHLEPVTHDVNSQRRSPA